MEINMYPLEEIFNRPEYSSGEYRRRIIMEEGMWCLYEKLPADFDLRFHIIHRCHPNSQAVSLPALNKDKERYITPWGKTFTCGICDAETPGGLYATLVMHRMDTHED